MHRHLSPLQQEHPGPLAKSNLFSRHVPLLALGLWLAFALAAAAAPAVTPGQDGDPEDHPFIAVDEPGVGAYWQQFETGRVAWRHNLGAGSLVNIEFSFDDGMHWMLLFVEVPNQTGTTGHLDVPVISKPTHRARVRVRSSSNPWVYGDSAYLFTVGTTPRPVVYRLIELGELGDGTSEASGLSSNGQVSGSGLGPDGSVSAFRWNGTRTHIPTLGGCCSNGTAIASSGDVVGWSRTPSGVDHAFIGRPEVAPLDLGTLGGDFSYATAVNDSLTVVGGSAIDDSPSAMRWHAFQWSQGVMSDLGTLGGSGSFATDVNNAGVVVGRSRPAADTADRAFVYRDGIMSDISPAKWNESSATAINDLGAIVGWRGPLRNETTRQRAFLRSPEGAIKDLGVLGSTSSRALDVNNLGDVVGTVDDSVAFLYSKGVMRDLNALIAPGAGWRLVSANAINDHGQIAVTGASGGTTRAALLTPIVRLVSLSVPARPLDACSVTTLTITLDRPAPENIDLVISTSGGIALRTPPAAVIPAGERSISIPIATEGSTEMTDGVITVAGSNAGALSLALRVRPLTVNAVSLSPLVWAGNTVPGTLSLPCVTTGDISVAVVSSDPLVAAVETPRVTIHPSKMEATFTVRGLSDGSATITAKSGGRSLSTVVDVMGSPVPDVIHGPEIWNGHAYYLLDASSWYAAERKAMALGGHLVTINDQAENDWVFDTFGHRDDVLRLLWLGLNDRAREGRFVWVGGEPSSFRRFDRGEPNNDPGNALGEEDVVHMFPPIDQRGGFWNDVSGFPEGAMPWHGVVEVPLP
jgi:probable HAF family extracellular repeat protein